MSAAKKVIFDAFPESAFRYLDYDAIICIDVICATTTLVTAVAQGRSAFCAPSLAEARELTRDLRDPLVAGEIAGAPAPHVFEMANSPAALAARSDRRPLVLVASGGPELILNARAGRAVYVACLRNVSATVDTVARRCASVAVLAACSRNQLRCEDQMAAARIVERLMQHGFQATENRTTDLVSRWSAADVSLARWGASADQLRACGQSQDLDFVLGHVDDVALACRLQDGEVKRVETGAARKVVVAAARSLGALRHDGDRLSVPMAAAEHVPSLKI